MSEEWDKYFKVVAKNIEVPTGKGKVKSDFWDKILQRFLASGDRNQEWEWTAKTPNLSTVRASLQRLTRGVGKKKDGAIISKGTFHGIVEVRVVKGKVYLVNVAKHKEFEESALAGKKKGR